MLRSVVSTAHAGEGLGAHSLLVHELQQLRGHAREQIQAQRVGRGRLGGRPHRDHDMVLIVSRLRVFQGELQLLGIGYGAERDAVLTEAERVAGVFVGDAFDGDTLGIGGREPADSLPEGSSLSIGVPRIELLQNLNDRREVECADLHGFLQGTYGLAAKRTIDHITWRADRSMF